MARFVLFFYPEECDAKLSWYIFEKGPKNKRGKKGKIGKTVTFDEYSFCARFPMNRIQVVDNKKNTVDGML